MKTLVDSQNLSTFLFNDDVVIEEENEMLKIMDGSNVFFLGDKNFQNTTIYYNVNAPQDWRACLYFFDGTSWEKNNSWDDPSIVNPPITAPDSFARLTAPTQPE